MSDGADAPGRGPVDVPDLGGLRPLVHVGLPRAASTTLQRNLLKHLPGVHLAGLNRFDDVRRAIKTARWSRSWTPLGPARRMVRRELELARSDGQRLVWSQEHATMTGHHRFARLVARARTVRRIFGDADVLIVLRDPRQVIVSRYRLLILRIMQGKQLDPPTFDEFLGRDLARESRRAGRAAEYLRYGELVEAYVRAFGRDRVHLMVFDDLTEDPVSFSGAVGRLVGLDAAIAQAEAERAAAVPTRNVTNEFDEYRAAVERFPALGLDELGFSGRLDEDAVRIIREQSARIVAIGGPDTAERWLGPAVDRSGAAPGGPS